MTKISNQYSLTNILTADLANSRLGINNVSPTVALDVTGAGKFSSSLSATSYNATTQNIFSVDGSEKMRITSTGNVGIGTTTVSSLLTLSQSAFNKTTLGDARVIRLENSDPTVQLNSRQEIGFGYSTAYQPVVIGHQITNNTDFTNGSFYIAVRSGVGNTAPVQALTVVAGGNVGIGTTSPSAKLEVIGYGTANSIMTYVCAKFYGAGTGGINIGTDGTNPQIATDSSGVDLTFLTRVAGTFSERMRITSGGNVLVGTTSDNGNKLQVSGGISASGNISGANIGGSSFSMNFGNAFNYGTGYLKSSTNGITVTTSTTTIFTSTNIGGVNSGNLVLVSGVRSGNGPTFTDLILYMNSGSISVISSQIFSTPPSRNYSVSNENLNLSMASGTYIVSLVALNQGYTNT